MVIINFFKIAFILGFLVFIHEGGHFLAAKFFNIKVEKFSIGFGPKIITKKGKETEYSVSLVPFGGYVQMLGETERNEDKRSFNNAKLWKRVVVVLAGPIVNIIFAIIVYFILVMFSGIIVMPVVSEILPEAKENLSEIKVEDRIIEVNGKKIRTVEDLNNELYDNNGENINIKVYREGKTLEYDIKPTFYEERYILGIVMKYSNNFTFGERIYYSYWKTIGFVASVGESLKLLVTGRVGLDQMTGPVGISNIVIKTTGIQNFINLLALISVSLGVTNLLPIPALDGGRLLIFVVEAIRRKPLEENLEMQIQAIGFSFLILLSIYVTYNDIFRIFER